MSGIETEDIGGRGDNEKKLPRLYVTSSLGEGLAAALDSGQAHYLKSVLRRQDAAPVRLFNGRDGEWLARLAGLGRDGGQARCERLLRPQGAPGPKTHLLFAPIKKDRLDFLIEKAAELGASDLHPVLTRRTEARRINAERAMRQIAEAAEQCERLSLPVLHEMQPLSSALGSLPPGTSLFACIERLGPENGATPIPGDRPAAFVIGPEGGFTEEERGLLMTTPGICPLSLGPAVLRAETAALAALSFRLAQSLAPAAQDG